jgi:hypothetical protein
MALDTLLQLIMPMIGLLLAVVIFTLWMFFDMISNEKIYFFAYKRRKLLTFFAFLGIAVILTIGGWLII